MLQLAPTLTLSNLADHMIPIEGGMFDMGGESVLNDAKPIHKVRLSDFELCRYLVSQQLWYEVMGTNPERLMFQNPHRPVERISWNDIVQDFLPRLREKTGDSNYCLPTEAQWEYAARGGKYARQQTAQQNFLYAGSEALKEVAWHDENSHGETHPTALKRPNALGLYDMSGNLWEWCQDGYDGKYYQTLKDRYGDQPAPNPPGPETGGSRVVRGGSWNLNNYGARVAYRFNFYSDLSYDGGGFRLCRYREA